MRRTRPAVVVMGVCGCGKSTLAAGLAAALGWQAIDGDGLHSAASIDKMRRGIALVDDDRWPWLDRIGTALAATAESAEAEDAEGAAKLADAAEALGGATPGVVPHLAPDVTPGCVVACSALRRAYRERLRLAAPGVRFVLPHGERALLQARLDARRDHFMPPALLDSQLATLELPGADEPDVLTVPLAASTDEQIALVRRWLDAAGAASPALDAAEAASPALLAVEAASPALLAAEAASPAPLAAAG